MGSDLSQTYDILCDEDAIASMFKDNKVTGIIFDNAFSFKLLDKSMKERGVNVISCSSQSTIPIVVGSSDEHQIVEYFRINKFDGVSSINIYTLTDGILKYEKSTSVRHKNKGSANFKSLLKYDFIFYSDIKEVRDSLPESVICTEIDSFNSEKFFLIKDPEQNSETIVDLFKSNITVLIPDSYVGALSMLLEGEDYYAVSLISAVGKISNIKLDLFEP